MATLEIKRIEENSDLSLLLFENRIQAGFPSPAQGSFADAIDLNRELINNPAATFCARVIGDSMVDSGIMEGDMLIIDRSLEPHDGDIAVCFLDGDFTVKRIIINQDEVSLAPANRKYPIIKVPKESNFIIWGVVSHIIKKLNR
ncbi:MAG: translesion error-prone DNA polymerase V autoproteolytic subunit [Muribaculaceae bacterium]|nr:translesion error-prone DNA polymerase V autoproteolytic subunit [Muribaculaceae bacterium]